MAYGAAVSSALVAGLALLGPSWLPCVPVHVTWVNGQPVPEWVRDACCGPADVHHLYASQVHRVAGGYAVDGVQAVVPWSKTLPSQDGDYWIFYRDFDDGTQYVFCFFAPPDGS